MLRIIAAFITALFIARHLYTTSPAYHGSGTMLHGSDPRTLRPDKTSNPHDPGFRPPGHGLRAMGRGLLSSTGKIEVPEPKVGTLWTTGRAPLRVQTQLVNEAALPPAAIVSMQMHCSRSSYFAKLSSINTGTIGPTRWLSTCRTADASKPAYTTAFKSLIRIKPCGSSFKHHIGEFLCLLLTHCRRSLLLGLGIPDLMR